MISIIRFLISFCLFVFTTSSQAADLSIKGEVWVDNWFSFYSGEQFIFEDSISITTERSFNSETFLFDAGFPLSLNFIVKDFKENDRGLEYIGTGKQQLGDGGLIAQFTDMNSGKVITVTDSHWRCMVVHNAPLDKSCKNESKPVAGMAPCEFIAKDEPDDWRSINFNDSGWTSATEFSATDIRPKGGFDKIAWYSAAKFIWSDDIEAHNTVLCRLTINSADEIKPISKDKATYEKSDRKPPPPPRRD